tara:strand:- start:1289 stop:1564 length:276 start_codon:yes stop_codon:yes gene_type:complete
MYKIKNLQKRNAKKIGVVIKPSTLKGKKIDVYKKGVKVASIGDRNYKDYATWLQTKGLAYANNRRRLYKLRHKKYRNVKGSASYYADKILW